MNVDAVNQEDAILNSYLSKILRTVMGTFFDPIFKYKPWKSEEVNELRKMIRHLRKVGKAKILERISAFQSNEHMPVDILSSILASYSNSIFII